MTFHADTVVMFKQQLTADRRDLDVATRDAQDARAEADRSERNVARLTARIEDLTRLIASAEDISGQEVTAP